MPLLDPAWAAFAIELSSPTVLLLDSGHFDEPAGRRWQRMQRATSLLSLVLVDLLACQRSRDGENHAAALAEVSTSDPHHS